MEFCLHHSVSDMEDFDLVKVLNQGELMRRIYPDNSENYL